MDLLLFFISSGMFFFVFLGLPKREKYGTLYTFLAIVAGAIITNLGIEPICGENWFSSSIGKIDICSTSEGITYIINDFGMRFLIITGLIFGVFWLYTSRIKRSPHTIEKMILIYNRRIKEKMGNIS